MGLDRIQQSCQAGVDVPVGLLLGGPLIAIAGYTGAVVTLGVGLIALGGAIAALRVLYPARRPLPA